nr:F390 synthetase-related protein [Luteolibacter marinus]
MVLWHFAATRWFRDTRDRVRLLARQQARLRCFLGKLVTRSPYYRGMPPELSSLPVITKREFLARFDQLNPSGITLQEASAIALRAEQERDFRPQLAGGITVGLSSGTSGSRHVFLVSQADRCRWAGQVLGRMLSPASLRQVLNPFARPLRIAFFLRAGSNLYSTLSSRRVHFSYFDLTLPFDGLMRRLAELDPEVLVAPATVLAAIARRESEHATGLQPRQVISVAEVLDPRDRQLIEAVFRQPVAQVYQAAEGLLGSTCKEGRIHLHEDSLHVEPVWLDDSRDRLHAIITDFSRTAQWFVRYQVDDLLRLSPTPCPCGSANLCLSSIEGRAEEVLWLPDPRGVLAPVFPDTLRQAIYTMEPPPDRYRIEQHGRRWEVRIRPAGDIAETAMAVALSRMADSLDLAKPDIHFSPWIDPPPAEKPKRIRCISRPA